MSIDRKEMLAYLRFMFWTVVYELEVFLHTALIGGITWLAYFISNNVCEWDKTFKSIVVFVWVVLLGFIFLTADRRTVRVRR